MAPILNEPWEVQEHAFPVDSPVRDQLRFLLNYAVLAPSGHNTQPWLFRVASNTIELYADRSRALKAIDPDNRELIMSCGAALFHVTVAMRHYGYEPVVRTFPDLDEPDLLAFIRMGPYHETTIAEHRLFRAIMHRRTHRFPFDEEPIAQASLDALVEAAAAEGVGLHVITDPERKRAIAALTYEGDRQQCEDRQFRKELATLTRPNTSATRDGIPGYSLGLGRLRSYTQPLVSRTLGWVESQRAQNRDLIESSPALLVLSTLRDGVASFLDAGKALDRVLLTAADHGVLASFLNQSVNVAQLRPRLAAVIDRKGYPQTVLRIGYGEPHQPTPRRDVQDVMARSRYL